MTQEQIYSAIKNSSKFENKAIELIFTLFYSKAKTIVLNHGLTAEDAQDLFQDCITDLCFKIKQNSFILWDDKTDGIQRFILKYIKFKSFNNRRRILKYNNSLTDHLPETAENIPGYKEDELLNKVFEIANFKSPRGAEVLRRRFINEQSFEDIALGMGYSVNSASARNQLCRVIREIRRENINLGDYIAE